MCVCVYIYIMHTCILKISYINTEINIDKYVYIYREREIYTSKCPRGLVDDDPSYMESQPLWNLLEPTTRQVWTEVYSNPAGGRAKD